MSWQRVSCVTRGDTRCRKGENIECKEEVVKQCRTVQKNVCKPEQKKVGLTCSTWHVVMVTRVPGVPH